LHLQPKDRVQIVLHPLRVQSVFPMFSGLPKDVITNTTHWLWDDEGLWDTIDGAKIEIAARLGAFYSAAYNSMRADYVLWNNARIDVINLGDPPPRVVHSQPLTVAATGGPFSSQIPTEVAICVSYHAAPTSGVPRGRLHNRFYLGGLAQAIIGSSGTTFPRIDGPRITAITGALTALLVANGDGIEWRQYSGVSSTEPGGVLREIVGGWVDNSPDTQRRRSVNANARTVWGL